MKILDEKKRITAKLRGKQNDDDDDDIYIYIYIYLFFHLDQARNFAVWKNDTLLHGLSMLPDEVSSAL